MPQEFMVTNEGDTVGTGYIDTSSQVQTDSQVESQAAGFEAQQQLEELQARLGVNLSDIESAQQPETPQPEQPPAPTDDMIARFNSAEGQRMRNEFKKIMGIDPMEAFQAVQNTQAQLQQIDTWRQQVVAERQMDTLKQEWGQDFDSTFSEVRAKFAQLPDNMKAALDNLDGARLLAAQIRTEQATGKRSQPSLPRSSEPSRTNNLRTTGAPVGMVKTSDYLNDRVSEQEYLAALQAGRVIRDI